MNSSNTLFTGSIPANYDKYLGPFLFECYASDIASRVYSKKPKSILETACGTGIATQKIIDNLPGSKILATDLKREMLEYAMKKVPKSNGLRWDLADAMSLPYDDSKFDALASQFGVMFFQDKQKAFREAFRVLKHDGAFIFNTWDSLDSNPIMMVSNKVFFNAFRNNPPEFLNIPFSFHEPDIIEILLKDAGFRDISISYVDKDAEADSAASLAKGIVEGNPIIGQINERDPSSVPELLKEVERVVVKNFGSNPVKTKLRALICSCRKP